MTSLSLPKTAKMPKMAIPILCASPTCGWLPFIEIFRAEETDK